MPYKDPEKRKEYQRTYQREYRKNNYETVRAYEIASVARNPETKVIYREKNREKCRASTKAWELAHPDRKCNYVRERRIRKLGAPGRGVTPEQWQAILVIHNHRCIYCGVGEGLAMDHLISLKRGGAHDVDNVAPACRTCNSRKGTKSYAEFMDRLQVA
jgi:5-methylcytosine-specific restriction endonuclease McrA